MEGGTHNPSRILPHNSFFIPTILYLQAELRGLTEQSEGLDLSSFIREVSSRIESQKQSIQNTQTTLHGIQRDLNQITNNV